MEASSIQDKELILRVLSMYTDPEQREREIKNLAAAYKNIAEDILPALRRSRIQLTIDLIGKSDAEILALLNEDASQLSVEELLFAATLVNSADEKLAVYEKAMELYSTDYRAYNNAGLIQYEKGNIKEAARLYGKALEIAPSDPNINYNAAVAAMADGDLAKAEVLLGKAAGTSSDLGNALGTLYVMQGDYEKAQASFSKVPSNNAALQQILNEDYNAARNTLAAVANPNGTTAYLQAVIAARTNDKDGVYSNLKVAIEKDAALKAKAAKDIEFAKFIDDAEFAAIIK
jgi:Flp pilus assembly protein TadD